MAQKFEQSNANNSDANASSGTGKRGAVRVIDDTEQAQPAEKSSCC